MKTDFAEDCHPVAIWADGAKRSIVQMTIAELKAAKSSMGRGRGRMWSDCRDSDGADVYIARRADRSPLLVLFEEVSNGGTDKVTKQMCQVAIKQMGDIQDKAWAIKPNNFCI